MFSQQSQAIVGDGARLRVPPVDSVDSAQLYGVVAEACQRLHTPEERGYLAVTGAVEWGSLSPRNAKAGLLHFQFLYDILTESQRIASAKVSQGANRTKLMEIFAHIGRAQRELIGSFSSALATAEAPLEVLRELFVDSKCSLRPEMISAALGILEESVGGDLLRHPSSERHTLFGRGGFMYQPSEPHELWQIFTVLNLKPGSLFVDLGSGYGHVVFQGAITRPDVRFKGIELMPVRVSECEGARVRHRISNLSFAAGDVTEGGFADADILFLFNPFPPDTKGAVAEHIESLAKSRPLAVLDYEGVATQAISNMVPVAVKDVAPYRVVCSRRFLAESCDLIGIRPPPQARR